MTVCPVRVYILARASPRTVLRKCPMCIGFAMLGLEYSMMTVLPLPMIVRSSPIVLLAAGLFLIINFLPDKNQPGNPKIEIAPAEYDAGQVPINGGLVKKTFEVKNSGIGALKIENIWTSCMCTKAVLKVGDKTSPEFGMPEHGSSPAFWSEEIKAGETAELEVIFDPLAHGPQGIGQIVRAVYLATNDPEKTKAEILFSANVIP